jgi:hypothetical protein
MGKIHKRMAGSFITALLVVGWGCGDGKPSVSSSSEEATVKGTVTIFGKPATGGEVQFDPSNYRRKQAPMRSTKINKDGTYSIQTLVGENTIKVLGPEAEKAKSSYTSFDLDVKSGEQTFPIVLPKP